ncbi:MAG TPA: hypothetical protein PKE45_18595, partial [Caldilineaceae bacterium]|nr:hypothetical protein [Caldilineaceae bacterium]
KESANPAILRALALFYVMRRHYAEAHAQGREILALAYQPNGQIDPVLFVEAHYVLGATIFWTGEFLQAKDHFEKALTVY